MENSMEFPLKTKEYSYHVNLGIYSERIKKIHAPPCSQQHNVQQPRHGSNLCPSTEEWIKKLWCMCVHTHTGILLSTYNGILLSHKKNETMPFAVLWIDLEIIILSQWEKDKYHITYMQSLKNATSELICNRNRLTQKTNLWLPKGKETGRDK